MKRVFFPCLFSVVNLKVCNYCDADPPSYGTFPRCVQVHGIAKACLVFLYLEIARQYAAQQPHFQKYRGSTGLS